VDRWVLSRLTAVTAEVDGLLERYEFAKACDALYHFAWDDVCDWYLELSKPVLMDGGDGAAAVRRVLGEVLDTLLRLLHPVMPFVTDELWTALTGGDSVMVADWPTPDEERRDGAAEAEVVALQKVVTEVRRFRSDQGLKPGQRVAARLSGLDVAGLGDHETLIRSLARLEAAGEDFRSTATITVSTSSTSTSTASGGVGVELDTRGSIDVVAERARLEKDLAAARKEAAGTTAKLGNGAFLAKAPEAVVQKIRDRQATAEAEIARLTAALGVLA
jgi:valyl-tRNA synthetase